MYEINNMKLRYTLIGVLCFSINIVLQAQQQALEGKIAGFLKGKKATVGVAVLTDKDETILHNNEMHYPLLSVFKFHVALAVLDKMNREEIPLKHIVHVKASQLQPNTYSPLRQKHSSQDLDISLGELLQYSISLSDNNACDILIEYAGGIGIFISTSGNWASMISTCPKRKIPCTGIPKRHTPIGAPPLKWYGY